MGKEEGEKTPYSSIHFSTGKAVAGSEKEEK